METIQISKIDFIKLKSLVQLFKEIDGDEDKSLELEDFYDLAEIGRTFNSILESILN
jgi:hypothetical protein